MQQARANIHHIIYRSTAIDGLTTAQVDEILNSARAFNLRESLSGLLLFDGQQFLQFLQGHLTPLNEAYSRIKLSSQHDSIVEIAKGPSEHLYFKNWDMGFCKTTHSELQKIANASWLASEPDIRKYREESEGVALLLDFWDSYYQERTQILGF